MKYVIGMFVVMTAMVIITLTNEYIFHGDYGAIASWAIVLLFLLGGICFVNARYYLSGK
ncbi:UNVERIFIED_CONTAM: hypothetical protein N8J90_14820 [Halobacillus marinus]